ncbi:cytochrome P450 [Streptosporangium saharense]|uniref:cytochrome P450 n=1 Tax=Streptosporangium saharense TaxID=1706840 RepID=UPI00367F7A82
MTETTIPLTAALGQPFPWPRVSFDPPKPYAWLRAEQPVTRVTTAEGQPVWLVTRYDDVRAILTDPRVSADSRNPGFPRIGARPPSDAERPFLRMDRPEHTVFRRLLARHFTVRRMQALEPRIQRLVDETIDAMIAGDRPVDLVEALALPVPSMVLSWIIGVRAQDRHFFNTASQHLLNGHDVDDPAAPARAREAGAALRGHLAELAAERDMASGPSDDILGALITAERDGVITRQDTVNTMLVLTVAGHDTTAAMTATGLFTLLRNPGQLAELRADPGLLPNAVEELLRYLTISQLVVLRVATEDIEIGGVVIPAGEGIVPLTASADRDRDQFADADRFDLHRQTQGHLAFGYGAHQCIGQALARIELQVILGTLLRRLPGLRLAVDPGEVPFRMYSQVSSVVTLPVAW